MSDRDGTPWEPAPPELIWPIYEAAKAGKLKGYEPYHGEQIQAWALLAAADLDPERTIAEAKAILKLDRSHVKGYDQLKDIAKRAIKRAKQIPEPEAFLRAVEEAPKAFSPELRAVARAYEVAEHSNNDGFRLYLSNCEEHLPEAIKGLELLGLPKIAQAVRDGVALDLGNEPAPAQEKRLAALEKQIDKAFDAIVTAAERYLREHAAAASAAIRASRR